MQCPVCDERMKEVERFGVSIDICPGCKGVWLDRGELDKLIAVSQRGTDGGPMPEATRSAAGSSFLDQGYASFNRPRRDHDHDRDRDHDHDRERYARDGHERDRRRGSWLGELFGGDD